MSDQSAVLEARLFHDAQPVTSLHRFVIDMRPQVAIPQHVQLQYLPPWFPAERVRIMVTRLKHSEISPGWHVIRAAVEIDDRYLGEQPGQIYMGTPSPFPSAIIPFLWPAENGHRGPSMVSLGLRHVAP